ncbi:NADH dehydrogenase [ubiquinone] 1 alpha subcomplex subunit 6 isoform X2 [Passer montanus]|uniref:NADH dehydrogenase [ubiquinone] 1 alpha subcomplex subunit 6 isoform X2 n=1 Tax=Passer montanus TaxID=9160 RepID=UPI0019619F9A|nr:NADH dehydrogenase [ubiquinone] 1 alpha subcomplex subunit 6 isoform X2 [Passer montanus]
MAVAGKGAVSAAVKPIFSRDLGEAKRRVRELYRAWYREVPNTVHLYQLDLTVKQGRNKVREMFMKNAHVTDPRVIDMLVIKGWEAVLQRNPCKSQGRSSVFVSQCR